MSDEFNRWKDGCPYNHEHGPWCDDAEVFRTHLQAYEQAGPGDEETKEALSWSRGVEDEAGTPICCNADKYAPRLSRALRSAWKALDDVTRERDEWKCKSENCRHDFMTIRTMTISAEDYTGREICAIASQGANRTAEWAHPESETMMANARASKAERERDELRAKLDAKGEL